MNVVVIGGGWAGIAAAIGAVENGWRVTVVEERPYLGGRARSFVDRETGDEIDNGQHVMMGAYTAAHHVMDVLGTTHLLEKQPALRVAFADATGHRELLDASRLPGKAGIVAALLSLQGLRATSRYACLRLAVRIARKRVHHEHLTCEQFLFQQHQPADAIKRFWEPIVLATLNAPLNKAAASLLVNVMRLAFLGGHGASSLWIPTSGLSNLIAPLPQWLTQHNSKVQCSTSADKIEGERGSGIRVSLSTGEHLQAQAVICAMPQRAMSRLFSASNMIMPLPPEPELSPIVSVYLWYDRDWLPVDFTAALGTTIQWVFSKRRITPGLVALTVSAAESEARMHGDELRDQCDAELRQLFPEVGSARLLHGLVIKEKHATPLITPEYEAMRTQWEHPRLIQLVPDEPSFLTVAGDWTVAGLPATIEAAARSGFHAVKQMARFSTDG